MGSRHRQNAPYQRFETKDGYMMIGAAGQSIWQRCARALGHPEWLEDPRFARSPERRKNRFALEQEITAVLGDRADRALDQGAGRRGRALRARLQLRAALLRPSGPAPRDGGPRGRRRAGPRAPHPHADPPLGQRRGGAADRAEARQHTGEILAGLGYTAADVQGLRGERVI